MIGGRNRITAGENNWCMHAHGERAIKAYIFFFSFSLLFFGMCLSTTAVVKLVQTCFRFLLADVICTQERKCILYV